MRTYHDLLAAEYAVKLIDLLASTGAHRATKYVSDKIVVRATRRRYKHRKSGKYSFTKGQFDITLICTRPNYNERKFIKLAKKAGTKFPISKTQLQY